VKSVCVYCGSSPKVDPRFLDAAKDLGASIARRNLTLVFGGANLGMMGAIADSVLLYGGRVVGVMHESLLKRNVAHKRISEFHVVPSIQERQKLINSLADVFIALPGGMGTLDELFGIVAAAQLGSHQKPCGVLNTMDYFNYLLSFLDVAHDEGFLTQIDRDLIVTHNNPSSLLDILTNLYRATNCQTAVQTSKLHK